MTNYKKNKNTSRTPHYKISNIIFENKNNKRIKFKILIKIILYILVVSILGAFISNISITYRYGGLIKRIQNVEKNGDTIILDYTKIIKEVAPSLVTISDSKDKLLEKKYFDNNITGVVIDSNGIILTNYSAIKNKSQIFVNLYKTMEEPIEAKLLVFDESIDLAIIKISVEEELEAVKIAEINDIKEGQGIVILGNAINSDYVGSVIPGIITSRDEKVLNKDNREYSLLQVSAVINNKNTGGVICNSNGEVIALANLTITKEKNENGLYYGLEISGLQDMVNSTNSFKSILGIKEGGIIVDKMSEFTGFYIDELVKNGSAYKAGIKPTDIIVKIDGHQVINVEDIIYILQSKKKDDILECSILSDGELKEVEIKVTE